MGGCVAVVVVPWQGWSRGVGQTSVPIEKVRRGVIFFSGKGRVGSEVFAGAVGGGAAMVPRDLQ